MSILDDILGSMDRMAEGEAEDDKRKQMAEELRRRRQLAANQSSSSTSSSRSTATRRTTTASSSSSSSITASSFASSNPFDLLEIEDQEEKEGTGEDEGGDAAARKKRKRNRSKGQAGDQSLSGNVVIVKRKRKGGKEAAALASTLALIPPLKLEEGTMPPNVFIVSQIEECREMVAELTKLEVIAVDCEGVNLSREGELCLVQIGTESKVYLVDVLEHGRALFEEGGLRALLESTKVRKVLHDCRGDSDAMYHQYGVALQNVFDTQIAYAVIKRQMGQGTPLPVGLNTVLRAYATPILETKAAQEQEKERAERKKQQQASGDKSAADAPFALDLVRRIDAINSFKKEERLKMVEDPTYWKTRPLTSSMVGYASEDVMFLCLVYKQMHGFLNAHNRKIAFEYSAKYVAQVRDLESLSDRPQYDGVPKYGFSSWDSETSRSLSLSNARRERRGGRGGRGR